MYLLWSTQTGFCCSEIQTIDPSDPLNRLLLQIIPFHEDICSLRPLIFTVCSQVTMLFLCFSRHKVEYCSPLYRFTYPPSQTHMQKEQGESCRHEGDVVAAFWSTPNIFWRRFSDVFSELQGRWAGTCRRVLVLCRHLLRSFSFRYLRGMWENSLLHYDSDLTPSIVLGFQPLWVPIPPGGLLSAAPCLTPASGQFSCYSTVVSYIKNNTGATLLQNRATVEHMGSMFTGSFWKFPNQYWMETKEGFSPENKASVPGKDWIWKGLMTKAVSCWQVKRRSPEEWDKVMLSIYNMEKLTPSLQLELDECIFIWKGWLR